jgi:hypothetical protein
VKDTLEAVVQVAGMELQSTTIGVSWSMTVTQKNVMRVY